MFLTPRQWKALQWLSRPGSGHTCSIVGAMLTERRSAYGHQTSAREGGRTLQALKRRGLVIHFDVNGGRQRVWELTPKGAGVLEEAFGSRSS